MISILYLTAAAALVSVVCAQAQIQQPQLVYEQHFLDAQTAAAQAPSFQPFPQDSYGGNAPAPPGYHGVDANGYPQPSNNNNNQPMGFGPQQHQPGHYQNGPPHQPPHPHAIGIPMQHPNSQPFMHQQAPPPQFMNQPPPGAQMIPMGMSPHEFADRRGPLDNMLGGGRPFKRGKKKPKPKFNIGKIGGRRGPPVKMMEMNRIPKPPKYPLYDMPNIGMATPPPAPLMHPMGHMAASSSNTYSTFVQSPRGGPHNQRRNSPPQNRRRPHPEPQRQGKRPPPSRNGKQPPRNHRRPGPGKKPHFQPQDGYDHPMASNLDPQVSSPPLGRPLSFDEYMERPSHSFTDDPWNFDPFAAQYNSGMNTYAMKYNYDPLGMNVVDGSQSHLDPNKLSYPGDYFSLQDTSTIMKSPKTSQLGGWDHPPETYRTSTTKLLPPLREEDSNKGRRPRPGQHNRHRERFDLRTEESRPNSFNVFDSSPADSTMVKSESLSPVSLVGSPGSGAPIEFSIESSGGGGGDDHYQAQYNVGQEGTQDYWQSHSQSNRPYQPNNYENDQSQNSYSSSSPSDSEHAQSRNHDNYGSKPMDYENSAPDQYAHARKEDYIPRERPVHDLSDHYNPMGEINTGIAPPHDDSDTLFRREGHHGMRSTRQEKTPMVELEGLSLFKDVLRNANASGARKHLYSALLN